MSKYLVAIPFYKNEHFIDEIIKWYESPSAAEDRELVKEILVVNDCPDSEGSISLMDACRNAGLTYVENKENIGYLKTVNSAYERAKELGLNLILLNSDIIPCDGFLTEINNCFNLDSMLGVVSARSNNATICNMYDEPHFYEGQDSYRKYESDRRVFVKYSPRISYVPVATGFCFAIRDSVIRAFHGFDEIYTVGYEEENDYCLRISERGFRIGVANKAFVIHLEGMSFGLTDYREAVRKRNANIIRDRYPFYEKLIENHSSSLTFKLQQKIGIASRNSVRIFLDARVLSPHHNGSNKVIVEFIFALSALGYSTDVMAQEASIEFHGIGLLHNINYIERPSEVYEYGIMLGQPMSESALWMVPTHSLVSICIFFDTIAHDCPQLRTDNLNLDMVWSMLPFLYSDISFISRHSLEQFESKFGTGLSSLHAHLLPVESEGYLSPESHVKSNVALVFGNKFLHKGIDLLLDELPTSTGYRFYVLGPEVPSKRNDIEFLAPGMISDEVLDQIMREVDFVIMPSFAEGYGFPLIESLSYGKPIYCRDIKCYREIRAVVPDQYKSLIRITSDFSKIFDDIVAEESEPGFSGFESYQEYVQKILDDAAVEISDSFFNRFKGRYLYIREIPSHKLPMPGVLKWIYSIMLKTSFEPYARRLKARVFTSPRLAKLLG